MTDLIITPLQAFVFGIVCAISAYVYGNLTGYIDGKRSVKEPPTREDL